MEALIIELKDVGFAKHKYDKHTLFLQVGTHDVFYVTKGFDKGNLTLQDEKYDNQHINSEDFDTIINFIESVTGETLVEREGVEECNIPVNVIADLGYLKGVLSSSESMLQAIHNTQNGTIEELRQELLENVEKVIKELNYGG